MMTGAGPRQRLAALGRLDDPSFPPAEAALWLAALGRTVEGGPHRHLDLLRDLAGDIAAAGKGADRVRALLALFTHHRRFRVDPDEDDDTIDLMAVIDRRRGDPDQLALLLIDIARRAGLAAEAMALPGPLLVRLDDGAGGRWILDPTVGVGLDPPDLRARLKATRGLDHELEPAHFVPLGNRAVLARVQNAVKLRLLRLGRLDRALAVVEGVLIVAPDLPPLWREAGMMHLRRGNPRGALAALEQFVARTPDAQARARTLSLMADLKSRLH